MGRTHFMDPAGATATSSDDAGADARGDDAMGLSLEKVGDFSPHKNIGTLMAYAA